MNKFTKTKLSIALAALTAGSLILLPTLIESTEALTAIDVNSACTSFFANVWVLSLMDPARLPEFVLLVVPDRDRPGT